MELTEQLATQATSGLYLSCEEAVSRAAAIVDQHWPEWALRVDLAAFDVRSSQQCVLHYALKAEYGENAYKHARPVVDATLEREEYRRYFVPGVFSSGLFNPAWRALIQRRQEENVRRMLQEVETELVPA